jgi:hypothetical protein
LKVKIEADGLRILSSSRLIIASHLVCPPNCVSHFRFTILIFVGRDYGALGFAKVASGTVQRQGRQLGDSEIFHDAFLLRRDVPLDATPHRLPFAGRYEPVTPGAAVDG